MTRREAVAGERGGLQGGPPPGNVTKVGPKVSTLSITLCLPKGILDHLGVRTDLGSSGTLWAWPRPQRLWQLWNRPPPATHPPPQGSEMGSERSALLPQRAAPPPPTFLSSCTSKGAPHPTPHP